MEYRQLGRTGVMVSELCLGTMLFGGKTPEEEAHKIVERSWEAGINFMDSANAYNRGVSEEVLGRALKQIGQRDHVVLATKVFAPMDDKDPNMRGNHRRHLIEQCEASLRRLQTDWIDLYQIHRPMPNIPIDETLRALDDLVRQGKVRYLGTSTFAAWQIMESLWVSREYGLNRFICEQPPYHLLDRRPERELIPMAQTYGMALIPWSPLAGGSLTGKYRRGTEPPPDARYSEQPGRGMEFENESFWNLMDVMEQMAAEKQCSISQLALAWCAQQPGITSPIIGPRTMEQLEDNLGSVDCRLTDEDRKRLDEVASPERALAPYYEADFGPHPYRV
ncbi:MAG: aldo/keto reductase [Armatimonadota bacterium]